MAKATLPDRPRWSAAPYLVVDDVVATANYYRDALGFDYDRFWNEPPSFCMVWRNGVCIMLAQLEQTGVMRPNRIVDAEGGAWDAYIWIDNADRLNAELMAFLPPANVASSAVSPRVASGAQRKRRP